MMDRRTLIIGTASSLFMPSIVKASWLMPLRGINMDPLVLAHYITDLHGDKIWLESCIDKDHIIGKSILTDGMNWRGLREGYALKRLSEIDIRYWDNKPYPA